MSGRSDAVGVHALRPHYHSPRHKIIASRIIWEEKKPLGRLLFSPRKLLASPVQEIFPPHIPHTSAFPGTRSLPATRAVGSTHFSQNFWASRKKLGSPQVRKLTPVNYNTPSPLSAFPRNNGPHSGGRMRGHAAGRLQRRGTDVRGRRGPEGIAVHAT